MTLFDRIRLGLLLNRTAKTMDFSKLKSRKLWVTFLGNSAIALFTSMGGLDPETAAYLVSLLTGGYLASAGLESWGANKITQIRGNLMSRKLWMATGTSVLLGLLTQLGLDPDLAAKLITGIGTIWLGAQGMADVGKQAVQVSQPSQAPADDFRQNL